MKHVAASHPAAPGVGADQQPGSARRRAAVGSITTRHAAVEKGAHARRPRWGVRRTGRSCTSTVPGSPRRDPVAARCRGLHSCRRMTGRVCVTIGIALASSPAWRGLCCSNTTSAGERRRPPSRRPPAAVPAPGFASQGRHRRCASCSERLSSKTRWRARCVSRLRPPAAPCGRGGVHAPGPFQQSRRNPGRSARAVAEGAARNRSPTSVSDRRWWPRCSTSLRRAVSASPGCSEPSIESSFCRRDTKAASSNGAGSSCQGSPCDRNVHSRRQPCVATMAPASATLNRKP